MTRFLHRPWLRAPESASLDSLLSACVTHERHETAEPTPDWIAQNLTPGQHATLTLLASPADAEPETLDIVFHDLDGPDLACEDATGLPTRIPLAHVARIEILRPASAEEAEADVADFAAGVTACTA
ncbi:MAG: hypothetical protein U1E45_24700 [Geminicoccaceae bacterium]